jgi:DNA repair protein RecO (recombination protein O)
MRSSRVYVVEGVVLKRRSSGEADRILTIFTKQYGKICVSAKGIRRITSRRAGHLEIFNHVILTLHQGHIMDIVTEAQSVFRGDVFSADITKVGYAYCVCELVDQLMPEKQEHRDVFILLRDSLLNLDKSKSNEESQVVLTDFIHHLLWSLGYLPYDTTLLHERMKPYVESITERRLRSWPLLTTFRPAS